MDTIVIIIIINFTLVNLSYRFQGIRSPELISNSLLFLSIFFNENQRFVFAQYVRRKGEKIYFRTFRVTVPTALLQAGFRHLIGVFNFPFIQA